MNRIQTPADENILTAEHEDEITIGLEEPPIPTASDEFDEEVQHAQEQLLQLRHQQEMIERQKAEIEELKLRRMEFMQGRTEVVDQLNRAIVSLERETYDAQKRVETFLQTKEAFERHLEGIEEFNPEDWSRTEMRDELTRALGVIEDAKAEYQKSMARVQSAIECSEMSAPAIAADPEMLPESPFPVSEVLPTDEPATLPVTKDFGYWFRAGFAFTLPLIIFGIFALAVYILLV